MLNQLTKSPTRFVFYSALLFVITLVVFWVLYLILIDKNFLGSDQFQLILMYDNILSGREPLLSIWEPKGGHRYPGYQLLFFINVYLFGFSPTLESIVAILVFSIAAFYLIVMFTSSVGEGKLLRFCFIALAAMILFNGQNINLSSYSLIAMRFFDFAGFVFVSLLAFKLVDMQDYALKENKIWLFFVVLLILCHLVFGRGWGVAASLALICVTALHSVSHKRLSSSLIIRNLAVASLVAVFLFVYLNGLREANRGDSFDASVMIKYYFIKHGFANISMVSSELGKNPVLCILFSVCFVAAYIFFLIRFAFYEKINRSSWLAIYLVSFSLISTGLVAMSRHDTSPYFPRHNFELSIGSLGLIYLIVAALNAQYSNLRQILSSTFLVIVASVMAVKTYNVVSSYKHLRNYNQNIEFRVESLFVDGGLREDYKKAGCPLSLEQCSEVFEIMRRRSISSPLQNF